MQSVTVSGQKRGGRAGVILYFEFQINLVRVGRKLRIGVFWIGTMDLAAGNTDEAVCGEFDSVPNEVHQN